LADILFPTHVVMLFLIISANMQTTNGSLDVQRNETEMSSSNTILPEINNNNSGSGVDSKSQGQSCKMPQCPPGEMCIQVCPDSAQ
jgi:hypothetical protein